LGKRGFGFEILFCSFLAVVCGKLWTMSAYCRRPVCEVLLKLTEQDDRYQSITPSGWVCVFQFAVSRLCDAAALEEMSFSFEKLS
jgi:hypothetical protein